jgi:hypothetical protein
MTEENSRRSSQTELWSPDASARLSAALAAGTSPRTDDIEALIEQCAEEPDFYVREMLTWALTRHDPASTVHRLVLEVTSAVAQARSQALHTLSKIGDRRAWPAITTELLQDAEVEVARAAWRAAVVLVPEDGVTDLAATLSTQFGRGDREVQSSLSRAVVALGASAAAVVERAMSNLDTGARTHAIATGHLMQDPDMGFDAAVAVARQIVASSEAPTAND